MAQSHPEWEVVMQILSMCLVSHDSTLVAFALVPVTWCPLLCYDMVWGPHKMRVPGLDFHISPNRLTLGFILTLHHKWMGFIVLQFTELTLKTEEINSGHMSFMTLSFPVCFFLFRDSVSLCCSGWPETRSTMPGSLSLLRRDDVRSLTSLTCSYSPKQIFPAA